MKSRVLWNLKLPDAYRVYVKVKDSKKLSDVFPDMGIYYTFDGAIRVIFLSFSTN